MLNRNTIYKFIKKNNKINQMKYQPINCSLFDRIETLAVTRQKVKLNYSNDEDKEELIVGIVNNVFSENAAEYLLIDEIKIRLDKINSISELKEK